MKSASEANIPVRATRALFHKSILSGHFLDRLLGLVLRANDEMVFYMNIPEVPGQAAGRTAIV
jgi:hypothetical protein